MMHRGLFVCLLAAAPAPAAEMQQPAWKASTSIDMAQWVGGLLAVLVAIALFAWVMRRLGSFSRLESGRFRVLAAVSLGSRERVVLVQAGEKQLVLGVAPGRVQALCILDGADTIKTGVVGATEASGVPFAERLATVVLPGKRP